MYNNRSMQEETKSQVMRMVLREDIRATCRSFYPLSRQ